MNLSICRNRSPFAACGLLAVACLVLGTVRPSAAHAAGAPAAPNPKDHRIELADGKIALTAPDSWVRKTPRVRFIDYEFAVPAAKGDSQDGRITVMGAGGSVDANIDRWIGQFAQPDGSETKNQVAQSDRKQSIAGAEVRFVDLSGTFHDSPAPFDPSSKAVEREGYRMLAVIVATPKSGNYFIKFYGPKKTVADHADEFRKMVDHLQIK
jgi:hypothetical protein